MKYLGLTLIAAALVACDNPADKTTSATTGEAETALAGEGTKFSFTEDSKIEFTGSKVTGSHDGGFEEFSGHFTIADGEDVPNGGRVTIQMESTWSDSEKLTGHLKNEDFFHVEKFPTATFELTEVVAKGGRDYMVSGNFTLHGVTKNITFPATASRSGDVAELKAEFDLNRKDFGIVYAGKTDDLIRDEVVIRFDLKAEAE